MKTIIALAALGLSLAAAPALAADYPSCSKARTDSCAQKQPGSVAHHVTAHRTSRR